MIRVHLENLDAIVSIDLRDLPLLGLSGWRARSIGNTRYMMRNLPSGRPQLLHRLIMEPPPNTVVDHIDGNGLNNARENLRVVSQAENLWNRKIRPGTFAGVSKRGDRWRATIRVREQFIDIGLFDTAQEAAMARDYVSLHLRGPLGSLNDPSADFGAFDPLTLSPAARRAITGTSFPPCSVRGR